MILRAPLLAAALLAGLAATALARPLTPAERRYEAYTGQVASCDDPAVLARIRARFAAKESEYWNSRLEIVAIDRVRQIGFRSWGADHIPRRYCTARAHMNDHRLRAVDYWVGESLGIIGWGFGVEWCVRGLDRNLAYSPGCKMARP
ncbi:MAG: hypothetical protein JNK46_14845 [Methylobacteriaceae bacterium]|nr:hypothetical protein [Methylobacteriaceae bacterium]